MDHFWVGFEKNAMTNNKIFRKLYMGMMEKLKNSPEQIDRALYKKYQGNTLSLAGEVPRQIRDMGEVPHLNWRHDSNPESVKNMVHEFNANKNKPGWVRKRLMRNFGSKL